MLLIKFIRGRFGITCIIGRWKISCMNTWASCFCPCSCDSNAHCKSFGCCFCIGRCPWLLGLRDSLRFSDFSEGLRKSGNEGVGEPQNQQGQKGSQTLPHTTTKNKHYLYYKWGTKNGRYKVAIYSKGNMGDIHTQRAKQAPIRGNSSAQTLW